MKKILRPIIGLFGKRHVYRSSVTGRIVTKEFADANPDTTFKDTF